MKIIFLLFLLFLVFCEDHRPENEKDLENQEEVCNLNKDCFSCMSTHLYCQWTNDKCVFTKEINVSFFSRLYSCTDPTSQEIMNTYCGSQKIKLDKDNNFKLSLPLVNSGYGKDYLFCQYSLSNLKSKNKVYSEINVSQEYFFNIKLIIHVIFQDGTYTQRLVEYPQYLVKIENAKKVSFYYFQKDKLDEKPFSILLTIQKTKISLTLILTIILTILLFILCGVSIFIISRKIAEKNRLKVHPESSESIAIRDNAIHNQEVLQREMEKKLKEARMKEIEGIFENSLKPIPFNNEIGKYNTNCTICIENFNKDQPVCFTECCHVFHNNCLKQWLITNIMNPKCPNCCHFLLGGDKKENKKQENQEIGNLIPPRLNNEIPEHSNIPNNLHNHNSSSITNSTNSILVRGMRDAPIVSNINKNPNQNSIKLVEQNNTINRVNDNNKNLAILKDYDESKEEQNKQNN